MGWEQKFGDRLISNMSDFSITNKEEYHNVKLNYKIQTNTPELLKYNSRKRSIRKEKDNLLEIVKTESESHIPMIPLSAKASVFR